jgi:hypothetical protein
VDEYKELPPPRPPRALVLALFTVYYHGDDNYELHIHHLQNKDEISARLRPKWARIGEIFLWIVIFPQE